MPVNIYEAIEDGHRTKNDLWLKYFKSKLRQSATPKMPWNMSVCRLETIKLNCNGFAIGEVEMKGKKKMHILSIWRNFSSNLWRKRIVWLEKTAYWSIDPASVITLSCSVPHSDVSGSSPETLGWLNVFFVTEEMAALY